MNSTPLIITGLTKRFDAGTINEKLVLNGFDLTVPAGQFVTLLGANGSGKTTLFNLILGRLFPDSGSIRLGDEDISRQKDYRRALNIGCLYQNPLRGTAPNMTLEENLALAAGRGGWLSHVSKADKAAFRDRLALLGMGLENRMKQPVGLLSGGQRQALTLLMATINPPKLLLLDEHTAALDPGTAEKVLELTKQIVAENHLTCLMITHNMASALELGNRTIMMDRGHIIHDAAGEKRDGLTVEKLLQEFKNASGAALDNDRMLLT